jgi:hypothetical protein
VGFASMISCADSAVRQEMTMKTAALMQKIEGFIAN